MALPIRRQVRVPNFTVVAVCPMSAFAHAAPGLMLRTVDCPTAPADGAGVAEGSAAMRGARSREPLIIRGVCGVGCLRARVMS